MKHTFMIGVAAGALLAGVNLAAAQGAMERQQLPGASGGANIEQKGAVQKKGGGAKAQDELKAGAEAQGGKVRAQGELKGGAEVKGGKRAQGEIKGGAEVKGGKRAQGEIKGGGEVKGGKARAQAGGEMKTQEMQKPGGEPKGKAAQPKAGTSTQGDVKAGGSATQGDVKAGGSATTGQGSAGATTASLTAEQKTRVRETVFKSGPRVTNVNFSLSVGTVVPRTVRFAPLPLILVEIYPQWRGYDYFIYEEEIIIIDPRTLRIVAVIVV